MKILWSCLFVAACHTPVPETGPSCRVYDEDDLVLTIHEGSGILTSTAPPPPQGPLATHPFLSGAAHSAAYEHRLRQILDQSTTYADYVQRLRNSEFRVDCSEVAQ